MRGALDRPADPIRTAGLAVHATAVAIGGRGLLIRGASGAGKSTLAAALIGRSAPARPIELVGDDRVLLHPRQGQGQRKGRGRGGIVARPHPRIAGFIERRGLGLVAMDWRERAVLAACIVIGPVPCAGEAEAWLRDLPTLCLDPGGGDAGARALDWWRALARSRRALVGSRAASGGSITGGAKTTRRAVDL